LAVHNNQRNTTTSLSPNQILIGYEPTLLPSETPSLNNKTTKTRIRKLMENHAIATDAINQSAKSSGTIEKQYNIRDQVWLEGKHLKFPHQATKLNPKRYGPFKIIKEISSVAYQLQLPLSWRIHPTFHASLLSPYSKTPTHGPNCSWPPPGLIDGEEEFEVKSIRSHQCHGWSRKLQYLIKWKGYPESNNTWEDANQTHAPDLIKLYHQTNPLQRIKGQ
jgi:Chromo (CHRromatin Organisation MOdifier) domain